MDPRDFLDVAFDLAGEFREADWRSAISRGYYAAFHVANDFMRRCGFSAPQGGDAHGYAWIRLSNSKDVRLAKAGRDLNDLRQERNAADYGLSQPVVQKQAAHLVRVAETIVSTLDQAAASPTLLAQVIPVMRDFERDVLGDVTWQGPTP